MTSEEMERAIEFVLNQQAKLTADVGRLDAAINEMRVQAEADRKEMRNGFRVMTDAVTALVSQAAEDRAAVIEANAEIKDRVNVLLDVIETTTKLTMEVSAIARSSEKRLTLLENRVGKIENPQAE